MEQKKLTELSLDELWQLFPITLTAHQDYWTDWYKEEAELLKERLPCIERISHIGSTAIKGIWAKPTIDILVEIPREEKVVNLKGTIERCGYICMAENDNRIAFNSKHPIKYTIKKGCISFQVKQPSMVVSPSFFIPFFPFVWQHL